MVEQTTPADVIVTIDDIRRCGYCVAGAKRWFEAHGLDFPAFLREGMNGQQFIDRGDELARQVVEAKIARHG